MLSEFFNIILKTNTFNFLVFAGIILLICKKINLGSMINNLQKNIETEVNSSTNIKKDSQTELIKAEDKIKKIEDDIKKIIEKSESTAKTISENIVSGAKGQIEIIENNAQKSLENDIHRTKRHLSEFTVKKSLELTKSSIKKQLEENKLLHQVYIDEALNKLEDINI